GLLRCLILWVVHSLNILSAFRGCVVSCPPSSCCGRLCRSLFRILLRPLWTILESEITIAIPKTTVSVGSTTEPQTYQCTAYQGTSIQKSGTSCDTDEKSTHLTCDMSCRELNCFQSG